MIDVDVDMVTARAVTDENGRTVSGYSSASYRASKVCMNATRTYERIRNQPVRYVNHIDTLLAGKYNLLAAYLIDKLNLTGDKMVRNGHSGRIKWIEIDGKTYWSRGYEIHDRY